MSHVELAAVTIDRRADEAARAFAHRGERLGQDLVEHLGDRVAQLALGAAAAVGAAQLGVDALALGRSVAVRFCSLQLGDARLELARALADDLAELRRLAAKLLFGDALEPSVVLVDLVDDRLDLLPLALVARSHDGVDDSLEHAIPLSVQPLRRDVVGDGIRHETSNRFALRRTRCANLGRRDVDPPRLQAPAVVAGIVARSGASPARCSTTTVASSHDSLRLTPLRERLRDVRSNQPEQLRAGPSRRQGRQCVNRVR